MLVAKFADGTECGLAAVAVTATFSGAGLESDFCFFRMSRICPIRAGMVFRIILRSSQKVWFRA